MDEWMDAWMDDDGICDSDGDDDWVTDE